LEVKRSKIKVTRPINAVIDNAPYGYREHYNFLEISLFRTDTGGSRTFVWGPDRGQEGTGH